jgi:choline monooxygenase
MPETLPASWYCDPEIHERERRAIFARHWWLLGPEFECHEPGAYRAETICGWPVLVRRGADGVLRGFHNVCRHRAAGLVAEGLGSCDALQCPYHGWSYADDGALESAANFGDEAGFDSAEYGLFPIRVAVWRGLIFICLDADGQDLISWLGPIPRLCGNFPTAPELEYDGDFKVEGEADWKAYCDNTVEGYHLPFVHRRLAQSVPASQVEIVPYDEGRTVVFQVAHKSGVDGDLRGERGLWIYHFPGLQLVVGDRSFKAERVESTGPGSLRSLNWSWYGDISPKGRKAATEWSRQIVEEDLGICQSAQRNLAAGVYRTGRLSTEREPNVALFQTLVRDALAKPW